MSSSSSPILPSLTGLVGERHVLVDATDTAPYEHDWRGAFAGRALAVVRPASTAEVASVVRACVEQRVPMVPQGGNTGMCGGAVPDASGTAVVIALDRLNRVLDVDPRSDSMTVEAGCVLARVQEAAAGVGRLFPLSLAAEGSCQIGGNLATNAGGINVLRYGNTRDLTLGIEAVLPDGSVWNGLRSLRKDNRGYDLKQLFIGAEGTLGIITSAVLRLFPRPTQGVTAMVAMRHPGAAITLLSRLRDECGDAISAYELIGRPCLELVFRHILGARDFLPEVHPWYVLLNVSGARSDMGLRDTMEAVLAEAVERSEINDVVIAESHSQADDLWKLRESIPEATRAEAPAMRSDIAVAIDRIPIFISRATDMMIANAPYARVICFGHVGDGNLHFNVLPPAGQPVPECWPGRLTELLYDLVDAMHGSFSAEHGIGQAKRLELERYKSVVELNLMRTLKRTLDPLNLMNPGKIL